VVASSGSKQQVALRNCNPIPNDEVHRPLGFGCFVYLREFSKQEFVGQVGVVVDQRLNSWWGVLVPAIGER